MTFINAIIQFLYDCFSFIGDAFGKLFDLLAYPLGWLIWLIEGIYYFLVVFFQIVVAVLKIFVALFQFFGALILGFMRTIKSLLFIDFSQTPLHYPSETKTGMSLVTGFLEPIGFLTVIPSVLLALLWIYFVIRIFALLGGEATIDA